MKPTTVIKAWLILLSIAVLALSYYAGHLSSPHYPRPHEHWTPIDSDQDVVWFDQSGQFIVTHAKAPSCKIDSHFLPPGYHWNGKSVVADFMEPTPSPTPSPTTAATTTVGLEITKPTSVSSFFTANNSVSWPKVDPSNTFFNDPYGKAILRVVGIGEGPQEGETGYEPMKAYVNTWARPKNPGDVMIILTTADGKRWLCDWKEWGPQP